MIRLPKRPGRWIAGAFLLLVGAAVAVPYVGADGFAAPIQAGMERALGRKVEINGRVRFQLVPRPGFSAADVVIHEDPKLGVEPFAYVPDHLEISLALSSIWNRRIEIGGIRLVEPSINLMKAPDGPWNVQSLLDHAGASATEGSPPPAIEVSAGRINFKSGQVKSTYYLADADLLIEASNPRQLSIRLAGEPARVDRTARAFGSLSGRGSIRLAGPGKEPHLELSLALERASVAELLSLIQGRSIGLGGFVSSRARLVGPVSNIGISGRLELDELERWGWLLPGDASPGFDFTGALDYADQTLEIETRAPTTSTTQLPLSVRFRATGLRAETRWAAIVTARGLPLASLRSLAQETGSSFPLALPLEGSVTGAVGFSPASGFRGQVRIDDATLSLAGIPPLAFRDLSFVAKGPELHMGPANVVVGPGQSAKIEGRFTAGSPAMDVRVVATGVQLAHLQSGWVPFTGAPLPGFLGTAGGGTLKGTMRFVRVSDEEPESWAGDVDVADVRLVMPGIAAPIHVELASVRLKGQDSSLTIHSGRYQDVPFQATYSANRLTLEVPRASVAAIEAALGPSLRRSQGFLARALRFGSAPAPEWLRTRQLQSTVRIGELDAGGIPIENVRARVNWDGARMDIREFTGTVNSAVLSGKLNARLDAPEPVWTGHVQLDRYPWREGRLNVDAALESAGLGAAFLSNLRLDGEFHHRDEAGCFTMTGVQEGRLTLELSSPQRTLRVGSADLALAK